MAPGREDQIAAAIKTRMVADETAAATTAADVPLDLGPSLNVDVPDGLQLGARIAAPLDFSAGVDPHSAPASTKSGVLGKGLLD